MAPFDCIVLALIVAALIVVCVRVRRRGFCAGCAQSGSRPRHRGAGCRRSCSVRKGVDAAEDAHGRDAR